MLLAVGKGLASLAHFHLVLCSFIYLFLALLLFSSHWHQLSFQVHAKYCPALRLQLDNVQFSPFLTVTR